MNKIEDLILDIENGKMVILVDDEDRENEGDLICAGSTCTAEQINFMAKHARGLICLSLSAERVDSLKLALMVPTHENSTPNKTAFTVSIEAATGISTGISAADRARTIQVASDLKSGPSDVISPGHIFPLRAHPEGVLARNGHTEASLELVRLAKKGESAVICEIMNDDGSMARLPDLVQFGKEHQIKIGSIADLVDYLENRK